MPDSPELRLLRGGDDPGEGELLQRAARGDQEAFADLYDAASGRVYGVVRRVVRDPARSEEVTQEVFTDVWRTASRFDPERGEAMSWILTIAHRRAVDCVRSVQASRDRDEHVGRHDHVREFDAVSEKVQTDAEHERVRDALQRLTDLQREAVELAYYGGYTYREVAELLDVPLGTIKTRMRDGMIRLRDALGVAR